MRKQIISSQERVFLSWLRSLEAEHQETLYQGIVTDTLPQALISITCEEPHSLFEIASSIGIEDDSLFVSQGNFFCDVVASTS